MILLARFLTEKSNNHPAAAHVKPMGSRDCQNLLRLDGPRSIQPLGWLPAIAGAEQKKRDTMIAESITSDKNVCAAFWAPTCSRYSYTYNANLEIKSNGNETRVGKLRDSEGRTLS